MKEPLITVIAVVLLVSLFVVDELLFGREVNNFIWRLRQEDNYRKSANRGHYYC